MTVLLELETMVLLRLETKDRQRLEKTDEVLRTYVTVLLGLVTKDGQSIADISDGLTRTGNKRQTGQEPVKVYWRSGYCVKQG